MGLHAGRDEAAGLALESELLVTDELCSPANGETQRKPGKQSEQKHNLCDNCCRDCTSGATVGRHRPLAVVTRERRPYCPRGDWTQTNGRTEDELEPLAHLLTLRRHNRKNIPTAIAASNIARTT